MKNSEHEKHSNPHPKSILRDEEQGRGYSYVGKRVRKEFTYGVIQKCPNCKARIAIKNVRKWHYTGAGLICNVCANTKPDCIVANDNYEVLKVTHDYKVILP